MLKLVQLHLEGSDIMATPAETMWNDFATQNNIEGGNYQTRWFGRQDHPDEINHLNELILSGAKRATAKPLAYYTSEQEAVPQVGDYHILLDGDMKPVAIIQTVVSELIPFLRISAEHAYNEGEGDLSLADWRTRSIEKFTQLAGAYDNSFSEEQPIVSETFKVVYRA
jgi:uncharacterized protein YhfF